jgi:hypothetical protein
MSSLKRRIKVLEDRVQAIKYPKRTYTFIWQGRVGSPDSPPDTLSSLSPHDVSMMLDVMTEAGYLSPDLPPWEPEDRAYTQDEFLHEIVGKRRRMTVGSSDDQQPDEEDAPPDYKPWAEYAWADLTEDEQGLWAELGWDEASWDDDEADPPSCEEKAWDELSVDEQDALWQLGFDRETWDTPDSTDEDVQ